MYRKNTSGWFKHRDFIVWDLVCLQAAFLFSYWLRFGLENPYADSLYRSMAVLIEIFDAIVFLFFGTFSGVRRRGLYQEFVKTVKHVLLLFALTLFYLFVLQQGEDYSRLQLCLMFLFYGVLTYFVRTGWKNYLRNTKTSRADRSLLIMTTRKMAPGAVRDLRENEYGNVKLAGLVIIDADMAGQEIEGVPVVADVQTANEYICREWVDEVFLLYPPERPIPQERIRVLAETGVILHINMQENRDLVGRQQILEQLGGYTVLTSTLNSMTNRQAVAKRAIDILGGLVGCAATGILFLFVAPAIKRNSPGPVFFAQERIGRNGKKFKMYKFRSMYPDAEERKAEYLAQNRVQDGMMFKMDFDPRVIGNEILPDGTEKRGIGDFIRRTSIDEFPQFFNVLKGDMSLVGTRPPTLDEWEKYEFRHRARMAAKPGITGMWQVSGRSEIRDFEEVVRLDMKYINNWSIGLDIRILLKTVKQVLGGKGAM